MSVITVSRADITAEQVTQALRAGLGREYTVTPGVRMPRNPLGRTRPASPEVIMVARGSGPMVRVQVTLTRLAGHTELHITPGGLTLSLIMNTLGIARTVTGVLQAALGSQPS